MTWRQEREREKQEDNDFVTTVVIVFFFVIDPLMSDILSYCDFFYCCIIH